MKNEIIKLLTGQLDYAYCDNCKYGDYDKYGDRYCDNCHRKYQNWGLSYSTANDLANIIDGHYKKIIQYLIDWLEDEHIGMEGVVKEDLKREFDYDIDN